MIRVLHVIGAMDRGGAETMIMNLYRAIDRTQIQFDFLVHEQRECDFDQEIGKLGGKIYRLPRLNGLNTLSYRRLCRGFFSRHDEHPIVHGHIGSSAAMYLAEAKRAGRIAIAHSHAQSFLKGAEKLGFNLFSYPTRFVAEWFFACSREAGYDRFGREVVEGDRFFILDNGIDVSAYRCDDRAHSEAKRVFGVMDDAPLFGHVGRLAPEKNHVFLLDAFARAKKALPSAQLFLVGRGPLESDLRQRADGLGLSESVRFLGVRDDIPDILRAIDVLVLPSVKEGLSLAAIEAQAAGVRTIMSTGVPARAAITDCACRVPLGRGAEAWAAMMRVAWEKASCEPRCDRIAQVRAAGFDVADTAARLQAFYLALAAGSCPETF